MSNVQQLYQLQQIDSKIDATNRRLKEIAANLVETVAFKAARAAKTEAEQKFKTCRANAADIDLDVKSLQQKIAKNEKRLYSGKVTNPKEAASLQDEVASTKRWLAKREEDLLEAMILQEDAETELAARSADFSAAEKIWRADQAELLNEQSALQAERETLLAERQKLEAHIEAADRKRYETMRAQKGGVAVTGVEDGNCLTCGVMLSHRIVQQAEDDSKITTCENCGRILFIL